MTLRKNKTAAYCGPFLAYMLFQPLIAIFKVDHPLQPWWIQCPELWIFPLQTVTALALLAYWWKQYEFRPLKSPHVIIAIIVGVVGIALWFVPWWLHVQTGIENKWLGMVSRDKDGFNPTILEGNALGYWASIGMRFVRSTLAVPFLEEIMMRGFIWRYLVNPDGDFYKVPFGIWHKVGVGGSILAFTLGHHIPDLLGCLVYAILISFVALRTKSLGACVICHAVSNFIQGIIVLQTGQWGFW